MALSATYKPETFFTSAVFYGCTDEMQRDIHQQLRDNDSGVFHPLLLPTIIAEIERKRHVEYVRKARRQLADRIDELVDDRPTERSGACKSSDSISDDSTTLWFELRSFKDSMENWRDELCKMISHVDSLSETCFAPISLNGLDRSDRVEDVKKRMRDSGCRIKNRLNELKSEYNSHIRDCKAQIEAMSLATQLVSLIHKLNID